MITADQLVLHALGDYVLQSDWMAREKTRRWLPAFIHAAVYALPFLVLRPSLLAFAVILATHAAIDRLRLARFVCWAKNRLAPRSEWSRWENCRETGYPFDRPAWMTTWLLIACDNLLHIGLNAAALRWL